MSARGELVFMVALLSSVLASSIKESGENLSEQAECRGACSLAREKTFKAGVKVLRALSCYHHCLNRRKGKTWRQERIKERLFFIATTFTKRHRRSLFLDPSLPMSSTALKPSDCVGSSDDKSVPEIVKPSKVDVTFGKYESTSYWYVNVSWTPLDDSSGHLYGALLRILINYKSPTGICTVLRMNQTFLNINISFYGYSYPESIDLLIHGLPYRKKLITMNSYKPRIPTSSTLTTLTGTTGIPASIPASSTLRETAGISTSSTLSETADKGTVTAVSVAAGILAGIILGAVLLKYCFCRKPSSYFPPEFEFHAFIIYQKEDSHWVSKELLPFLEDEHHIKCCIHYRDFTPGLPFLDSMAESVYNSYKIIAVFSSNFLQSSYCTHELDLAQYRLLNRRDDSLIIIRIDKTDPSKLPPALEQRNFIDYSDVLEKPFWKGRLIKFLNSSSKNVSTELDNNNSAPKDSNDQNEYRPARTEFLQA